MDKNILLPCGIALTGALIILFTYIDSKDKENQLFKITIQWGIIICLCGNVALTFWLVLNSDEEKKEEMKTQIQHYANTMDTLSITLAKSDSLLDSLREVKHNTEAINKQLEKELVTIKNVDSATQELIAKDKEIMAVQTRTYQANNRILNPLFPLEIQIEFEISVNSPLVNKLRKYIRPRNTASIWVEESCNIPWQDSIIQSFDIYFIEESITKLSTITPSIRQFNFGVYSGDVTHKLLEYFYRDSTFYFTLIYSLPTFRSNRYQLSSANIGFSDLEHCYVGIRPYPYISDYKLVFLKLATSKGLRHSYGVWFSKNKGIIDDCSLDDGDREFARVYIQKIKSKQSMATPKNRKTTMYHY